MAEPRKYSAAEVQEILRRAAEKTAAQSDDLEHDELVSAAREAGLDPAAVEAAAAEVHAGRLREDAGRELRERKRKGFLSHLSAYLIVNVALVLMSLLVTARPWSAVVAIGWGIGLAFHLLSAFREPTKDEIQDFVLEREAREKALARVRDKLASKQREHEERQRDRDAKEQKRQEKKRRKQKIADASEALESAVEKGVAAVLEAAAAQLDQLTKQGQPQGQHPSEFSKYVQEKKRSTAAPTSSTHSSSAAPSQTGVRVDAREPAIDAPSAGEERVRIDAARSNAKART
jgi:hypothetical protein